MELARARMPDGPRVVVTSGDPASAALAVVDGRTFEDLPALLEAADGESHSLRRAP
jgi:hypothetical protein